MMGFGLACNVWNDGFGLARGVKGSALDTKGLGWGCILRDERFQSLGTEEFSPNWSRKS